MFWNKNALRLRKSENEIKLKDTCVENHMQKNFNEIVEDLKESKFVEHTWGGTNKKMTNHLFVDYNGSNSLEDRVWKYTKLDFIRHLGILVGMVLHQLDLTSMQKIQLWQNIVITYILSLMAV